MKKYILNLWSFIQEIYKEWTADNCFQLAAALSYYTIFSLAPMLIIIITIAGYFFGREAVSGELYHQIKGLVGPDGAKGVQDIVERTYLEKDGFIATVIGIGTLVSSATLTFTALQNSLNIIWKVQLDPKSGILRVLINRLLSFSMVLGIGFFLMISLVLDAVLAILNNYIVRILDEGSLLVVTIIGFLVANGILLLMFAVIFKFLPDARIKWRHVWQASILTTILFSGGKYLIGYYIGQSNLTSTYGAAASVVITILWINYSSWIFFVGAEYAYVYARRRGEEILPAKYAVKVKRYEILDTNKEASVT